MNGFAVRNARVGQLRFDVVLVAELAADNLNVHFAEALNQHVAGFGVLLDLDGRVFFLNAVQAGDDLIAVVGKN